MAEWSAVEAAGARAHARHDVDPTSTKLLARRFRRDGSPRISRIDAAFVDGRLWHEGPGVERRAR